MIRQVVVNVRRYLLMVCRQPEPKVRPEDVEKTRTPYGTQRQIGRGLYPVSAYVGGMRSFLPIFKTHCRYRSRTRASHPLARRLAAALQSCISLQIVI